MGSMHAVREQHEAVAGSGDVVGPDEQTLTELAPPAPTVLVAGLATGEFAVQTKLEVGGADDPAEAEADHIADGVVAALRGAAGALPAAAGGTAAAPVRRDTSQHVVGAAGGVVSEDTDAMIASARGSGRPLPEALRVPMEHAFGADFGGVRVHTGGDSDTLNRRLSARAFTTGHDIFFRDGLPDLGSDTGAHLLAHELAHVVQQHSAGPVQRVFDTVSSPDGVIRRDDDPTVVAPREDEADAIHAESEELERQFDNGEISEEDYQRRTVELGEELGEIRDWQDQHDQGGSSGGDDSSSSGPDRPDTAEAPARDDGASSSVGLWASAYNAVSSLTSWFLGPAPAEPSGASGPSEGAAELEAFSESVATAKEAAVTLHESSRVLAEERRALSEVKKQYSKERAERTQTTTLGDIDTAKANVEAAEAQRRLDAQAYARAGAEVTRTQDEARPFLPEPVAEAPSVALLIAKGVGEGVVKFVEDVAHGVDEISKTVGLQGEQAQEQVSAEHARIYELVTSLASPETREAQLNTLQSILTEHCEKAREVDREELDTAVTKQAFVTGGKMGGGVVASAATAGVVAGKGAKMLVDRLAPEIEHKVVKFFVQRAVKATVTGPVVGLALAPVMAAGLAHDASADSAELAKTQPELHAKLKEHNLDLLYTVVKEPVDAILKELERT